MNDWFDYKGSGSARSRTLAHAFNFRKAIDRGVKAVGDVVTLPFKTSELGRQLEAYANLITAKREMYDSLVAKANQYASDSKNIFKLSDRDRNKREYEKYKREANKVAQDINKIKNEAESDISRYQQYIKNNDILGPIVRTIEDSAKSLPSILNMTFDAAATNFRSRR